MITFLCSGTKVRGRCIASFSPKNQQLYLRSYSTEKSGKKAEENPVPEVATEPEESFVYEDPVETEIKQNEEIENLKKNINDMKYNWRLALADTDNLTKKSHKEVALAREAGADNIIKKLFPITDNIDYCLKYKPDFSLPEFADNLQARGAFDGLEAAKKQFCNTLMSYDTTEIYPMIGEKFDPLHHEAVFQMEGGEPGTIGEVMKNGWIKRGILLRPASVGVYKFPEPEVENQDQDVSVDQDEKDADKEDLKKDADGEASENYKNKE